jgi:membrane protein implicated in regulation of membrane protease activity
MDQILGAAIVAVVAILVVVGVVRVARRRIAPADQFGAGGRSTVPAGTNGYVKSMLAPSGIVTAAGEDWSARSRTGDAIAPGTQVTVTDQDGITLIVEAVSTPSGTQG